MNCRKLEDQIAAYLEGLLDADAAGAFEAHVEGCAQCRTKVESSAALRERLEENGHALEGLALSAEVMNAIGKRNKSIKPEWRIAMILKERRGLSAAAAALVLAAAVAAITLLGNGASAVYALDKALEASKKVTTVHYQEWVPLATLEAEFPKDGEFAKKAWADYSDIDGGQALRQEVWAEFDGEGQLLRLRLEWPVTEDGRKEIILRPDQVDIWFVHKGAYLVMRDERAASMYSQAFLDPKKRLESLNASITAGKVKIESTSTSHADGTTTYNVVYPELPAMREEFVIDQKSHLLLERGSYQLSDGAEKLLSVQKFSDYNVPIDASRWVLDAPDDVIRVNQITQVIGIAKGEMTDAEVAKEGVRQFFEALIKEDYETAGRLLSGIPADKVRELLGSMRFLRIISLGEPTPPSDPRIGGLRVPYKVEIEVNGEVSIKEYSAAIRPVHSQPDRWTIHGGI